MWKIISAELRHHAPFTLLGAVVGVLIVLMAKGLPKDIAHTTFYILHPGHVLLSAMATASIYQKHICRRGEHGCNPWKVLAIGYMGSVGIATLSDSIIPYIGEKLLALPHTEAHIGFIEAWWLVNPLAIAGVAIAYYWPRGKAPHVGHVLLSTGASLFHMMMAVGQDIAWSVMAGIALFLFVAVWVPCCLSDIIFPLLFVGNGTKSRGVHEGHSHS